jgi:hypothetical protein
METASELASNRICGHRARRSVAGARDAITFLMVARNQKKTISPVFFASL